ncbi:unnamed protein product [Echinostoma caproni]|uniref:Uncharacterized protein n=1 Tax=Echinostoma caproni TaxID=27848 RepID=A0A3P8IAZ7_9TREM|nr:unnamed protein product [Echinostoma caproni]
MLQRRYMVSHAVRLESANMQSLDPANYYRTKKCRSALDNHSKQSSCGMIDLMPEDSGYRKHTTEIVRARLQAISDINKLEKTIDCGQIEEVIVQVRYPMFVIIRCLCVFSVTLMLLRNDFA